MYKNIKKYIALLLTAVIILLSVSVLSSCGAGNPPPLEDVYDRIVYLIERSYDVNMVLFGEGLPVYSYGSELADVLGSYSSSTLDTVYDEMVSTHSKFLSISDMKTAAEKVYSSEYLESVYESVFTGLKNEDDYLYARYSEDSDWIYQSSLATTLNISRRVYDYSSMEIVKPSSRDYLYIKITSYRPEDMSEPQTFKLSFVWENGNWFLDSPTY